MKKKPTIRSLRQGQTIYIIAIISPYSRKQEYQVEKIFIYSHKVKLPESQYIVEKYSTSYIKQWIKNHSNNRMFYSKNKAQKLCNRKNIEERIRQNSKFREVGNGFLVKSTGIRIS